MNEWQRIRVNDAVVFEGYIDLDFETQHKAVYSKLGPAEYLRRLQRKQRRDKIKFIEQLIK